MKDAMTNPYIIVDSRESSRVKMALIELGSKVVEKAITPADYILSSEYAVERKSFGDFLGSVYDGRLFEQVERLAAAYGKPVLLVEGDSFKGLAEIQNPLVFWGALAKVTAEWGVSIIFTLDENCTAMFLHSLSKKLNEEGGKRIIAKRKPRVYTLRQRQVQTLQSLPNIGPERADKLLKNFGSLRKVFTASDTELLSIEGLGKKTLGGIKKLLDTMYPGLDQL